MTDPKTNQNVFMFGTPQVVYSLVQSLYGLLFALIVSGGAYFAGQVDGPGFVVAMSSALAVALQRVYLGWQDGVRAVMGDVLPRDVGAFSEPLPTPAGVEPPKPPAA